MARPTKYNEDILTKTKEYISSCEDKKEIRYKPKIKDGIDTGETEAYLVDITKIPTIEGLAYYLEINKTTIYEWCKVHEEFSNVIGDLQSKQANALINKGLSGDYSPVIAKVLLTKHGYRDSLEQTGADGGAIKIEGIEISVRK